MIRFRRRPLGVISAALAAAMLPGAASPAFLYWARPAIPAGPVVGDEPGIALPLPGAKPEEVSANLLWAMRAGLNVAALQCQFSPGLLTVRYYNEIMRYHAAELMGAYKTLSAYFKRTGGKTWQTALDSYTTRTYNGFSVLNAQQDFCETAAAIDRDAMTRPRGQLLLTAQARMREFRNSLIPVGEAGLSRFNINDPMTMTLPPIECFDKKDRQIDCYTGKRIKQPKA